MILRNNSQTGIAALAWIWKTQTADGRTSPSSISMIGGGPSVLAPFGLDDRLRKLYGYWHVVLPGSKRLIRGNELLGDNTDVRPPHDDEIWKGGFVTGVEAAGEGSAAPWSPSPSLLTASSFSMVASPARIRFTTSIASPAGVNAKMEVAKIARDGHNQGLAPTAIFEKLEAVCGPDRGLAPPPPPPMHRPVDPAGLRRDNLQDLADQIAMMRQHQSDDRVIYTLMSWTETPLPNFRRL